MKSSVDNVLILNNIRSAQNVGSLFRTADAAGIDKIYLIGITPTPKDRFGKPNNDIKKTALGAENSILYEYKKTILPLIKRLKKEGYKIISIEQSDTSVDYKKVKKFNKNVFILGNEVEGLPKNVLRESDVVAEIPMKGIKESLNVSVAGGIFLFRILNL